MRKCERFAQTFKGNMPTATTTEEELFKHCLKVLSSIESKSESIK